MYWVASAARCFFSSSRRCFANRSRSCNGKGHVARGKRLSLSRPCPRTLRRVITKANMAHGRAYLFKLLLLLCPLLDALVSLPYERDELLECTGCKQVSKAVTAVNNVEI